jgi:ABC-type Fe3+ transport system permease subunit
MRTHTNAGLPSAALPCQPGGPVAVRIAMLDGNTTLRRVVCSLVVASLVVPPFLGAIAWKRLTGPKPGSRHQLSRPAAIIGSLPTLVISCPTPSAVAGRRLSMLLATAPIAQGIIGFDV